MYGDDATKLVLEARRAQLTRALPKYNDTLVRQVAREARQLGAAIDADTAVVHAARERALLGDDPAASSGADGEPSQAPEADEATVCRLTVHHLALLRNKRCLLAYHAQRVDALRALYWGAGGALAHLLSAPASSAAPTSSAGADSAPTSTRDALAPSEVALLRAYAALQLDTKSAYLDVLDLAADISAPPGELYADVRVLRDCGTVYTEMGQVTFRRGQRYMVRRADVERLITQGFLEEV